MVTFLHCCSARVTTFLRGFMHAPFVFNILRFVLIMPTTRHAAVGCCAVRARRARATRAFQAFSCAARMTRTSRVRAFAAFSFAIIAYASAQRSFMFRITLPPPPPLYCNARSAPRNNHSRKHSSACRARTAFDRSSVRRARFLVYA